MQGDASIELMGWTGIIATGVLSALVSAAILFVFRTLVFKHFLPWYFDQTYHGIRIDGQWHASPFEMSQDLQLNLSQIAGKVEGTAQFLRRPDQSRDGIEDFREFTAAGRIQDRYLSLTLSHLNKQRIGVISLLLEPICDGREMQGQMSFVSMRGNYIDSLSIHLAREREQVVAEREAQEALIARAPPKPSSPRKRAAKRAERSSTHPPEQVERGENPQEKIEIK